MNKKCLKNASCNLCLIKIFDKVICDNQHIYMSFKELQRYAQLEVSKAFAEYLLLHKQAIGKSDPNPF